MVRSRFFKFTGLELGGGGVVDEDPHQRRGLESSGEGWNRVCPLGLRLRALATSRASLSFPPSRGPASSGPARITDEKAISMR